MAIFHIFDIDEADTGGLHVAIVMNLIRSENNGWTWDRLRAATPYFDRDELFEAVFRCAYNGKLATTRDASGNVIFVATDV